jgi:hypothetical protein
MYMHQDTYNWAVASIYHVLLVLFGAFLCLNLALAVIASTFEEMERDEKEGKEIELQAKLEALGDDAPEEEEEDSGPTPPVNSPVREMIFKLCTSAPFRIAGVVAILLNTASLAIEHKTTECLPVGAASCIDQAQEMNSELETMLETLNYIFVIIFAVEMVILIIGLGPIQYVRDPFNVFDGTVVIISIVEVALAGKGVSALRAFRLARVFKMAKEWDALRAVIESLIATLPNIASCCLLLILFMFMASIAGMQLLGQELPVDDRARFSSFGISMLTIFSLLCGENWIEFL